MKDTFALFKQIESENKQTVPVTHMLVGLGNPGDKYTFTRHNTGFLALDYICDKLSVKTDKVKFKSLCCECMLGSKRTLLLKPQTFMNNSGEAVKEAASFYKIPAENIIVVFDDISLDVGRMRIRAKGSHGGHNGIKSIATHLSSDAFPRIKVGIGAKPHPEMDLADWVLSKFNDGEKKDLFSTFDGVYNSAALIADGKMPEAMNKYNS